MLHVYFVKQNLYLIRLVYVLSENELKDGNREKYLMIFDLTSQIWTMQEHEIYFGYSTGSSRKLVTLRDYPYFFQKLGTKWEFDTSPIYRSIFVRNHLCFYFDDWAAAERLLSGC